MTQKQTQKRHSRAAEQHRTTQNNTEQHRTTQSGAWFGDRKHHRATQLQAQNNTEQQNNTGQHRTTQNNTEEHRNNTEQPETQNDTRLQAEHNLTQAN
jgi:hypothetical protein